MPTPTFLTPTDLDALAEKGGATVIDTRSPEAFRRGHFPGSLLVSREGGGWNYASGEEEVVLVVEGEGKEAIGQAEAAGLSVRGVTSADVLAAWGGPGGDRLRMLKAIDFDELDGRRHYTNVIILDVRDRTAWKTRHIPGSVNIPHDELPNRLGELPHDRTILVHCQRGAQSAVAAALLHARGFCVAHVADDLARWRERHLLPGVVAGAH